MSKKSWSLKTKLIASSVVSMLLVGGLAMGIVEYIEEKNDDAVVHAFSAQSDALGNAISAQYFERYGDIQAFAVSPAIQSGNRQTIVDMLNTFSALYGIYDLIMLVDSNGKLIAVNDKDPSGKSINVQKLYSQNYSSSPWFKAVMNNEFTEDKQKGFSGTFVEDPQKDPYVSDVYGENRLGSSFSAAVKNAAGKTIGVITNRAGSRWFEAAFKEAYQVLKDQGHHETKLHFISKDGLLYYSYEPNPKAEKLEDANFDWNKLLKFNVLKSDTAEAKAVETGKVGSALVGETIIGYAPVDGPKFTENLGWHVLVESSAGETFQKAQTIKMWFYIIFSLILTTVTAFIYFFSNSISKRLMSLANSLSQGGEQVAVAASQIAASSGKLSEAAVEQAAAIQETASAIDEVSAMVKKNSENAAQSKVTSAESRTSAETGQESVKKMIHAISDISDSNEKIISQVEEGNKKISEIVNLISEIGNKTKVINDIVFQTKLLSFNASVEAARAGEHGKGFAVVAEEVGSLAQMSGNAAKEISEMLDSSIRKVEDIITETKSSVERLVTDGKTKVDIGKVTAQECGSALDKILSSVQDLDSMVTEIADASTEQSQGVDEINKAMNQLDQATQQNSAVSQSAAESAQKLNQQSNSLKASVHELFMLVHGKTPTVEQVAAVNAAAVKNNVVHFKPKEKEVASNAKVRATKPTEVKPAEVKHTPVMKKAVGETQIPSHDDARFEDI